jgi:ribonuclease D
MIISLIQLSTLKTDYIIDCFVLRNRIRESHEFKGVFTNEEITKILHGCDSDIKYLVADLGIVTINLFDTARALSFI